MNIIRAARRFLFPEKCRFCGSSAYGGLGLCASCLGKFTLEAEEVCPLCGCTVDGCVCGTDFARHTTMIGSKPFAALTFYKSRTSYPDSDRLTDRMIFSLKSGGYCAEFFADGLARRLREMFRECGEDISVRRLTYIPRTDAKLIDRGVDQSEEIAVRLAKKLGIPMDRIFARDSGTEQKALSRAERTENMEKSLYIAGSVKRGGKYLLFDDIITSGASMISAARLLRFEGADEVFPVSAARTMMRPTESNNIQKENCHDQ